MVHAYDRLFMQQALALARRGWGKTSINPLVGTVIAKKNRVVGRGYHRKIGEAHAEITALIDAGARAQDATLYVNLEPCCCTGRTPPCVPSIISAKIKRVVIGMRDPNPQVNGKGIEELRAHGVHVTENILADQAQRLNRSYKKYITSDMAYVILKMAISKDGKISGYDRKYITGETSRRFVHSLRSQVCCVIVGINTVLADNPQLTDRLVGRNHPARCVIDPHLKIPLASNFLNPDARRIIVTSKGADQQKCDALRQRDVEVILFKGYSFSPEEILKKLTIMGFVSILIEGGNKVLTEFFSQQLYDEIYLFQAPAKTGDGLSLEPSLLEYVLQKDSRPEKIKEDVIYHVYRNN